MEDLHVWVGAATVDLTPKQAAHADLRGSIRVPGQTRIDVLETYCKNCRRPYDEVADQTCIAAADNSHLIGGPTGKRRPRTHEHDCVANGCTGTGIPPAVAAAAIAGTTLTRAAR